MNALVKDRLDRLDQAINDLVASVSAYNPSPAAAVAVVEADDALDEGLVQRKVCTLTFLSPLLTI